VNRRLEARPDLKFNVVVNPNNGPGDGLVPNEQYTEALTKLGSYSNARMLGYVRTGYATRDIDDVIREINVYAGWSSNSSSLAMQGIFLDEAPHQYTAEAVDFMHRAGRAIKSATGLHGPRTVQPLLSSLTPARGDTSRHGLQCRADSPESRNDP
jgi:hypothetical protein